MKNILQITLLLCWCFTTNIKSQEIIKLKNPSFEDLPHKGGDLPIAIFGWKDCGSLLFPGESPPDIHPLPEKAWGVSMVPAHGKTYLGLVTRYNNSHESISQKLKQPLVKGNCYTLSAYLAQSPIYLSPTMRSIEVPENYTFPVVLIIGAGNSSCHTEQMLAKSIAIDHHDWRKYIFEFQAHENYDYLLLHAYYNVPILAAYNGHVLVDGLSSILEVSCQ